jgi:hypothetical protein
VSLWPSRAFVYNQFQIFRCCLSVRWTVCCRMTHSLLRAKMHSCKCFAHFGFAAFSPQSMGTCQDCSNRFPLCKSRVVHHTELLWLAISDRSGQAEQLRRFRHGGSPPPLRHQVGRFRWFHAGEVGVQLRLQRRNVLFTLRNAHWRRKRSSSRSFVIADSVHNLPVLLFTMIGTQTLSPVLPLAGATSQTSSQAQQSSQ